MNLTKSYIKSLAIDEETFGEGFTYYKNGRVTHAVASKDQSTFQFTVKGNYSYKVSVQLTEDEARYTCNCSAHVKHKEACKHAIAALLFVYQFQHKNQTKNDLSPEDYRSSQILNYYMELDNNLLQCEVCHLYPHFYYKNILRKPEDTIIMRLSIGNMKEYKIQSVKKMIETIRSGQSLSFGKDFTYHAGTTEFDRSSNDLYQYLEDVLSLEESYQIVGEKSVFDKNEIKLTKRMFLEVMKRIKNISFTFSIGERLLENVHYVDYNPFISYDIDVQEGFVSLGYSENSRVFPLSVEGDLMFYDNVLYHPTVQFTKNYLPIYNSLSKDNPQIIFRGDNAKHFLEEVLPRLSDTMNLQIPDSLRERYLTYPMQAKMYLDYVHGNIRAEVQYTYGEYTFNSFSEPDIHGYILMRDKEAEAHLRDELAACGFENHHGYYLLCDNDAIFDFASGERGELDSLCEILYSESFHKLRITKGEKATYGAHMKSGEDYLTLEISYEDIPKQELKKIFQSMQLKKKYYRLKDGNFLLLDSESLNATMDLIHSLNGSIKQMKDNTLMINTAQVCYLEEALKQMGSEFVMDESIYELLSSLKNPEEMDCPPQIQAVVRKYQQFGYSWMRNLAAHGLGGILADDMGLGKTLQAIMYIASLPGVQKSLIVCPTSLLYNWKDEFENFAPNISCCIICGTPDERREAAQKSDAQVLITSYPLIRRDLILYKQMQFETVIIDEAQNIKNSTSINAMSVKQLQADTKFALTGTPIENSLSEIWSIFDFVMPGYLHTHSRFVNEYEKPIMNDDKEKMAQLNIRISPFILRRMKHDVLKELPEKVEEKILVDLSDKQKKLYAAYLEHYKGEFHLDDENPISSNRIQILSALMRLRQICCHPATFMNNYEGDSSKLELLRELLNKAVECGHRVLVFSQFTSMLDIIKEMLEKEGISYFCIAGETKIAERNQYVKQFNEGVNQVFLISLKAGGTGLNLVGADTVIHVDPWWNPAVEDQATDRAYRIGQTRNVHVIKLLAKGTIEEKIYRLQKKKQLLVDSVIDKQDDFLKHLSKDELKDIFS